MNEFRLFPEQASNIAVSTDHILYGLLILSAVIILLVLSLIVGFAVRYRRGSKAKRGELPQFMSRDIEIGWTAGTLFLALFIAWWASASELGALSSPSNALEIHVVAKQWMWKTEHPSGAREINALHIPVDEPVRLAMTSQDVIHSFFIPAFRIKQDVVPGRYTETWFTATKPGTFHLFCAEFCGTDHSHMTGEIVVMPANQYADWAHAQPQGDDLAHEGEALFRSLGCSGCHVGSARVRAPDLRGLFGRSVELADGRTVTADEAYLRDSILQPRRDVVAGYEPIMPSYAGQVGDDEMIRLTAYIRSLKAGEAR